MLKPLSSYADYISLDIGPGALRSEPQLAAKIMHVVATCSQMDDEITLTVCHFLSADFHEVTALLDKIVSQDLRTRAILEVAQSKLKGIDFKLFDRVIKRCKSTRKKRNKFVHHLWASSSNVPNAVCLVEPQAAHKDQASQYSGLFQGQAQEGGRHALRRWGRNGLYPSALV